MRDELSSDDELESDQEDEDWQRPDEEMMGWDYPPGVTGDEPQLSGWDDQTSPECAMGAHEECDDIDCLCPCHEEKTLIALAYVAGGNLHLRCSDPDHEDRPATFAFVRADRSGRGIDGQTYSFEPVCADCAAQALEDLRMSDDEE